MASEDKTITATEIREIFKNQQDNIESSEGSKVLISHFGTFSQDLISSLSDSAEELIISSGDKKIVVKRMYSILIEGLQNIRLHGRKDGIGRQLGYLILTRTDSEYRIIMANLASYEDQERIEEYMEQINNYSEKELKEKYMSVLTNEFLSDKGGAGLGFITTRIKSKNELRYSFYALKQDLILFTFDVRINRK
jgi:hypothetical protein